MDARDCSADSCIFLGTAHQTSRENDLQRIPGPRVCKHGAFDLCQLGELSSAGIRVESITKDETTVRRNCGRRTSRWKQHKDDSRPSRGIQHLNHPVDTLGRERRLFFGTMMNERSVHNTHTQRKNCRLTLQLSKPIVPHDVMGRRSVPSRATSTPHFQPRLRKRAYAHERMFDRRRNQRPPTSPAEITNRARPPASLGKVQGVEKKTLKNSQGTQRNSERGPENHHEEEEKRGRNERRQHQLCDEEWGGNAEVRWKFWKTGHCVDDSAGVGK